MSRIDESRNKPEVSDLERRILAHERILQTLIAFMSESEPRFVDHLKAQFMDPKTTDRHEQDYTDTDDYAEEFVRAVIRIGETSRGEGTKTQTDRSTARPAYAPPTAHPPFLESANRVQLTERSGIWELRVDGAFRGDYHLKEHGVAAAAAANRSL